MDKRYWVKKGTTYREVLRCPLCGKLSKISYFSQDHQFGVYRFGYGGRGKISCSLVDKPSDFTKALIDSIVTRLLYLLKKFTGQKYYSQTEVDHLCGVYNVVPSPRPVVIYPVTTARINGIKVIPQKVVVE